MAPRTGLTFNEMRAAVNRPEMTRCCNLADALRVLLTTKYVEFWSGIFRFGTGSESEDRAQVWCSRQLVSMVNLNLPLKDSSYGPQ